MAEKLDGNKIAMLTGIAIQDDETFKSEGGIFQKLILLTGGIAISHDHDHKVFFIITSLMNYLNRK